MPCKLNLVYKKHSSVKRRSQDIPEEDNLNGVAHSSTQTDLATDETPATETISTQADSVDTCDVAVKTAKEPLSDHPNLFTLLPFNAIYCENRKRGVLFT